MVGLPGGVLPIVGVGSNVVSLTLEGGTLLATQFQGRGDGCECLIDGLNLDFISLAVST